jgi:hypothetical protein
MPLDYKLRTTLLRYVPNLKEEQIDNLDSNITEAFQNNQTFSLKIEPFHIHNITDKKERDTDRKIFAKKVSATILENNKKIKEFMNLYERRYYAAHKILAAQRSFALHQRYTLQIPTTSRALWKFIKESFYFRMVYTWFNLELWIYWLIDNLWPEKK